MSNDVPASKEPAATTNSSQWASRIVVTLIAAVAIPLGVSLLYCYAPTEHTFYPGCTFHWLTGFHCPGCGATRCCHALVHGDIEQAFAWNPLFVILLPALLFAAFRTGYTMWTGKPAPGYRLPGWFTKILLWTLIAYWVARNIPYYPFNLLAPTDLSEQIALGINEANQVEAKDEPEREEEVQARQNFRAATAPPIGEQPSYPPRE